jgi:hypothetical protein
MFQRIIYPAQYVLFNMYMSLNFPGEANCQTGRKEEGRGGAREGEKERKTERGETRKKEWRRSRRQSLRETKII